MPSAAVLYCSNVVWKARDTATEDPLTVTSIRLADTELTLNPLAAAQAPTALTVLAAGANWALN